MHSMAKSHRPAIVKDLQHVIVYGMGKSLSMTKHVWNSFILPPVWTSGSLCNILISQIISIGQVNGEYGFYDTMVTKCIMEFYSAWLLVLGHVAHKNKKRGTKGLGKFLGLLLKNIFLGVGGEEVNIFPKPQKIVRGRHNTVVEMRATLMEFSNFRAPCAVVCWGSAVTSDWT